MTENGDSRAKCEMREWEWQVRDTAVGSKIR